MAYCPHCENEVPNGVHVRWCKKNPNLKENKKKQSVHSAKTSSEQAKKQWADGKMDNVVWANNSHPHTEKTKKLLSEIALSNPFRRVCKSTRDYKCLDGTVVKLDSSWEEKIAILLDENNIKWTRPDPVKWVDNNNKTHHYYPDFYLTEYNIYLDPKNDYVIQQQKTKLKCLEEQYNNIFILREHELNINYINALLA